MEDWKRNLLFTWIAQFFSIMGFSFAIPFAPFYLQKLGITDPVQLRLWSGVFTSAAGLTMAIMTPFWGYLADRIGKKPMALRASLAGTITFVGIGFAQSFQTALIFRFLQGAFTGTVVAYLTLVVSKTPKERIGLAIGLMNGAVFFGDTLAPLFGGMFADAFGYRACFFMAAGLLFLSFLTTLLFVQEQFTPQPKVSFSFLADTKELLLFAGIFPTIGLISFYWMSETLRRPMLPLLIQELVLNDTNLATKTGLVTSVAGMASVLAGILLGSLADRGKTLKIGVGCALLGGSFGLLLAFAINVWYVAAFNFLLAFFIGGLDPILNILITRIVPEEKRGSAFGLTGSARAFGHFLGPLSGGILAAAFGLRIVFVASALLFVGMAGMLARFREGKNAETNTTMSAQLRCATKDKL